MVSLRGWISVTSCHTQVELGAPPPLSRYLRLNISRHSAQEIHTSQVLFQQSNPNLRHQLGVYSVRLLTVTRWGAGTPGKKEKWVVFGHGILSAWTNACRLSARERYGGAPRGRLTHSQTELQLWPRQTSQLLLTIHASTAGWHRKENQCFFNLPTK